jgi:cell division protein FtsI/penicillin-binding protein 2
MRHLKEGYNLNPLTLVDNLQWHSKLNSPEQVVGFSTEGKPIKRLYKGGFLPRSHAGIGTIDLVGALEQSSNIYFSLLASDHIEDPSHLIQATENFGFGEKTGIELPGEISGGLPKDLAHNRTGLYTFAIGQHSLVVTPLQTAVMLSSIANKGSILKPKILQALAGQEPLREYQDPFSQSSYPFKECLSSIGIHFSLFTSTVKLPENPHVWINSIEMKRPIPMPAKVRTPLLEGMHRVITGVKGTARPGIIRALRNNPTWAKNFNLLKQQLIGKTGTAEILYKHTIDSESKAHLQNHIWFGGVSFTEEDNQTWEHPELTVVVYLRSCQAGGKEAAPLAAEMVKKWREIRQQHGKSAHMQ